jgi:hypothetical protein
MRFFPLFQKRNPYFNKSFSFEVLNKLGRKEKDGMIFWKKYAFCDVVVIVVVVVVVVSVVVASRAKLKFVSCFCWSNAGNLIRLAGR